MPGATPENEWAFVNLFHSRFPAAHFRFLWVIHVDEFDEFRPSAGLLIDPFLSRFLPPGLVSSRLRQMGPSADASLLADAHHTVVLTPDGFTISDPIFGRGDQRHVVPAAREALDRAHTSLLPTGRRLRSTFSQTTISG